MKSRAQSSQQRTANSSHTINNHSNSHHAVYSDIRDRSFTPATTPPPNDSHLFSEKRTMLHTLKRAPTPTTPERREEVATCVLNGGNTAANPFRAINKEYVAQQQRLAEEKARAAENAFKVTLEREKKAVRRVCGDDRPPRYEDEEDIARRLADAPKLSPVLRRKHQQGSAGVGGGANRAVGATTISSVSGGGGGGNGNSLPSTAYPHAKPFGVFSGTPSSVESANMNTTTTAAGGGGVGGAAQQRSSPLETLASADPTALKRLGGMSEALQRAISPAGYISRPLLRAATPLLNRQLHQHQQQHQQQHDGGVNSSNNAANLNTNNLQGTFEATEGGDYRSPFGIHTKEVARMLMMQQQQQQHNHTNNFGGFDNHSHNSAGSGSSIPLLQFDDEADANEAVSYKDDITIFELKRAARRRHDIEELKKAHRMQQELEKGMDSIVTANMNHGGDGGGGGGGGATNKRTKRRSTAQQQMLSSNEGNHTPFAASLTVAGGGGGGKSPNSDNGGLLASHPSHGVPGVVYFGRGNHVEYPDRPPINPIVLQNIVEQKRAQEAYFGEKVSFGGLDDQLLEKELKKRFGGGEGDSDGGDDDGEEEEEEVFEEEGEEADDGDDDGNSDADYDAEYRALYGEHGEFEPSAEDYAKIERFNNTSNPAPILRTNDAGNSNSSQQQQQRPPTVVTIIGGEGDDEQRSRQQERSGDGPTTNAGLGEKKSTASSVRKGGSSAERKKASVVKKRGGIVDGGRGSSIASSSAGTTTAAATAHNTSVGDESNEMRESVRDDEDADADVDGAEVSMLPPNPRRGPGSFVGRVSVEGYDSSDEDEPQRQHSLYTHQQEAQRRRSEASATVMAAQQHMQQQQRNRDGQHAHHIDRSSSSLMTANNSGFSRVPTPMSAGGFDDSDIVAFADQQQQQQRHNQRHQQQQNSQQRTITSFGRPSTTGTIQRANGGGELVFDTSVAGTLPKNPFSPPKIIVMLFSFANVMSLPCVEFMRKTIGYSALYERFHAAIDKSSSCLTKTAYTMVMKSLMPPELTSAHDTDKLFACFEQTGRGDIDVNIFLMGLQMLLGCATPGDALRYCIKSMDPKNGTPRYITRYEIQSTLRCVQIQHNLLMAANASKGIEELTSNSNHNNNGGAKNASNTAGARNTIVAAAAEQNASLFQQQRPATSPATTSAGGGVMMPARLDSPRGGGGEGSGGGGGIMRQSKKAAFAAKIAAVAKGFGDSTKNNYFGAHTILPPDVLMGSDASTPSKMDALMKGGALATANHHHHHDHGDLSHASSPPSRAGTAGSNGRQIHSSLSVSRPPTGGGAQHDNRVLLGNPQHQQRPASRAVMLGSSTNRGFSPASLSSPPRPSTSASVGGDGSDKAKQRQFFLSPLSPLNLQRVGGVDSHRHASAGSLPPRSPGATAHQQGNNNNVNFQQNISSAYGGGGGGSTSPSAPRRGSTATNATSNSVNAQSHSNSAKITIGGSVGSGVAVDREFTIMYNAIVELFEDTTRYDYLGRMALKDFVDYLSSKLSTLQVRAARRSTLGSSAGGGVGTTSVLDGGPLVAPAHRLNSKQLVLQHVHQTFVDTKGIIAK